MQLQASSRLPASEGAAFTSRRWKGHVRFRKIRSRGGKACARRLKNTAGPLYLRNWQALDPEYAQAMSPNDTYRVTRALIVIHGTGRKLSELRAEFQGEEVSLSLGENRHFDLAGNAFARVEKRTREMLEAGLLDEVRGLVEDGFGAWPALQSVGHKEALQCLSGELVPAQLAAKIMEKRCSWRRSKRLGSNGTLSSTC